MPLFFVLSGYLFYLKKDSTFISFIINKTKSLLIPYISFNFVGVIIEYIYKNITNESISIKNELLGVIIGKNIWNGPTWFLLSLFIDSIIFYFIIKYIKKTEDRALNLFLIFSIGILMPRNINDFFRIKTSLIMIIFFAIGYSLKNIEGWNVNKKKRYSIIFVGLISTHFNDVVRVSSAEFGDTVIFILTALISIVGYISISKNIKNNKLKKILKYYGTNSLIVLLTHWFIIEFINLLFKHYVLISIFVLLIEIPIIYIVNKYFGFLIGKKCN